MASWAFVIVYFVWCVYRTTQFLAQQFEEEQDERWLRFDNDNDMVANDKHNRRITWNRKTETQKKESTAEKNAENRKNMKCCLNNSRVLLFCFVLSLLFFIISTRIIYSLKVSDFRRERAWLYYLFWRFGNCVLERLKAEFKLNSRRFGGASSRCRATPAAPATTTTRAT